MADEQARIPMNDQVEVRIAKLDQQQAEGRDPFAEVTYEVSHHASEIVSKFAALEGQSVRVAGRLMSKRGMGKTSFCDLNDRSGRIQLYARIDVLGEEAYQDWQQLDRGDIIGVKGEVMKTQRGEVSLRVTEYTLLAKCLRPLPEKFHGLQDTETRYRQRYLDLIMNPEVRRTFEARSTIIRTIRKVLDKRNFLEVETPMLHQIAGGANARPFITHHNALDIDLYLRIALELHLKRLLVGGMERVYEMGRVFRNEGMDSKHNPEFTMLELYQAYTDYEGMMELTEKLVVEACQAVNGSTMISLNGKELDLTPPFRRMTMRDAVLQETGIDFYQVADMAAATRLAEERQLEVQPGWGKGDVFNLFFETFVEDKLQQPIFIYDYPVEVSPLSKRKPEPKDITYRFELFVGGGELANAFTELNDPRDQRARFEDQVARRDAGDDEATLMDEDYVTALEYGLPPTGGMGMGIDRLAMILTDNSSIRDVLLFPTMKPLPVKSTSAQEEQTGDG